MDGDLKSPESYVTCPTCKGKGYLPEIKEEKITRAGNYKIKRVSGSRLITNTISDNINYTPKIAGPRNISNPIIKVPPVKDKLEKKIQILPNKMTKSNISNKGTSNDFDIRINKLIRTRSNGSIMSDSEYAIDLIGHEEIDSPTEYAKLIHDLLSTPSKDWWSRMEGLQKSVHLSRVEPDLAVGMGRLICRTILDELTSLRSKCVRIACQAAKEIFRIGGGFIFRPVFDEIVNVLLNRTADSKKIIREDADDALGVIASYCPVQHVTRAFSRGVKHKNMLVRKSALRMLKTMINRIGISSLMKTENYRDVRGLLLEAGCTFLNDQIAEIRNSAREVMEIIVKMPEFEAIKSEINKTAFNRVEKIIFNLKYELNMRKK